MLRSLLKVLFPANCVSCGAAVAGPAYHLVCGKCAEKARAHGKDAEKNCAVCGAEIRHGSEKVCYRCSVTPYRFGKNTSILDYREPVVRELTHLFKFGSNRLAGRDLALLMRERMKTLVAGSGCDITVPVPLSVSARRKRGFNQVERILDHCDIKYFPLLERQGHASRQSELGAEDRKKSIMGQFRVGRDHINFIQGKKILLVDDVYTTGSTSNEISGVLLDAGAVSVDVLTFFRD